MIMYDLLAIFFMYLVMYRPLHCICRKILLKETKLWRDGWCCFNEILACGVVQSVTAAFQTCLILYNWHVSFVTSDW